MRTMSRNSGVAREIGLVVAVVLALLSGALVASQVMNVS